MIKNILKLKNVQEIDKTEQKAIGGGRNQIDPHCCLQMADYYMEEHVPNYVDPSYEMYLTYEQRHDIWTQVFDGCMGGQAPVCIPVGYVPY
ncbi:hypothetical protein [Kordia sp.]|uniref:hypothetical protein n=1 Tax=Kordia sp. TaxID=1965332 RepID=UPI003B59145D